MKIHIKLPSLQTGCCLLIIATVVTTTLLLLSREPPPRKPASLTIGLDHGETNFLLPLSQDFRQYFHTSDFDLRSNTCLRHGAALPLYRYVTNGIRAIDNFIIQSVFPNTRTIGTGTICCRHLIQGDRTEQEIAKQLLIRVPNAQGYITKIGNCQRFKTDFGYITHPLTKEEETFPLAYSILMYKDIEQVERLLRAIYRPQNFYCFHVDSKSSPDVKKAIDVISGCFDNVFVSSRSVDVVWGSFSVLEPELICMEDLWRKSRKWKYFINLTGQEFPLRTNWELVQILRTYNGANDIESTLKRINNERFRNAGPPPHSIIPVKGAIHIIASRELVDFALYSNISQDFLNWTTSVDIPDEVFFSSLAHNPQLGIKGSYKGIPETDSENKPFLARYKNWFDEWKCYGKKLRNICVHGVGDLPLLATREEMFVNKFEFGFESVAQYCLDELLRNRTIDEYYGVLKFNTTYYSTRDFVLNTVK